MAGGPEPVEGDEQHDQHSSVPESGVLGDIPERPERLRASGGLGSRRPLPTFPDRLDKPDEISDASVRQPSADRSALIQQMAASVVLRPDGTFDVPVKLTYAGAQGAREWIAAAQDPDYVLREAELHLVEGFFSELRADVDEIIEFGPGDGYKAAQIVGRLAQHDLRYTAFDSSNELLDAARLTLSEVRDKKGELNLQLEFLTLDLEDPTAIASTKRPSRGDGETVGMLLGQTLGNPTNEGRVNMLRNIHARLPENGQLLIGVALVPDDQKTIEQTLTAYRAESQQRQSLIALEHLGVADAGKLDIVWDDASNTVVGHFTFDQDVTVAGTALSFRRGQKAQVLNSHRFTETELVQLLNDTGFHDVKVMKSASFPYALASARVVEKENAS
ncbi:L-histidine N(alpha)-methyltransferase [Trinickia sp. LjRoot230]|uniref:L-histidine N(alpha)-methyltransferase n=1 Tax=Trinickia sp. LjRoot230 TaxID=3342288 RepID=UPI003ED0E6CE